MSAGHWITLHDEDGAGGVHCFIGGPGVGSSVITKGPKSLVGGDVKNLAAHAKITHHGQTPPPGATSHPTYHEHVPPEKNMPKPGKPHAREHGAAQTRQEQPEQGPKPLSADEARQGLDAAREAAKQHGIEQRVTDAHALVQQQYLTTLAHAQVAETPKTKRSDRAAAQASYDKHVTTLQKMHDAFREKHGEAAHAVVQGLAADQQQRIHGMLEGFGGMRQGNRTPGKVYEDTGRAQPQPTPGHKGATPDMFVRRDDVVRAFESGAPLLPTPPSTGDTGSALTANPQPLSADEARQGLNAAREAAKPKHPAALTDAQQQAQDFAALGPGLGRDALTKYGLQHGHNPIVGTLNHEHAAHFLKGLPHASNEHIDLLHSRMHTMVTQADRPKVGDQAVSMMTLAHVANAVEAEQRNRHLEQRPAQSPTEYLSRSEQQDQDQVRARILLAEHAPLSPLEGSPKQVAWAETIRAKHLPRVAEHVASLERKHATRLASGNTPELSAKHLALAQRTLVRLAKTRTNAGAWIDDRDYEPGTHVDRTKTIEESTARKTADAAHAEKGAQLLAALGNIPPLTQGSPRQQVWAERDIRPKLLQDMATHAAKLATIQHPDAALAHTALTNMHSKRPDASWWIDRKDEGPSTILERFRPKNTTLTASHHTTWERATDMTHALFRKWTADERSRAPDDVFCGPGRTFPLEDQADLDAIAHLIGKAKNPEAIKAKAIARAHKLGLTLPAAWQTVNNSADFGMTVEGRRVEGQFAIYPNAVLWRAGDYSAAKSYEMSPEDNWLAVEHFTPITGNIEHSNFMKGRACEVRSIRMDADDPHILRGEVAVPLGLDTLLGPLEKRLSCEWDRSTKRLKGIALTTNPFIPEAVLMSANAQFNAQHDTPSGQAAIQAIHDAAAEHGAICSQRNANMHSRHEHKALQAIHDMAMMHGASCFGMPGWAHGTDGDADDLPPPSTTTMSHAGGKRPMRNPFKDWFALGRDARELARDAGADVPDEVLFSTVENEVEEARAHVQRQEVAKLEAQRADLQRELAEAREAKFAAEAMRMQGEAAAFADGLVAGNKLFPAERETLITTLVQASMDDARHGAVTFSASGTPTSRVEQVKAMYQARPAHALTKEQIKEQARGGQVLFNTTTTEDLQPHEADHSVDDLLGMTIAGKHAIKNGRG